MIGIPKFKNGKTFTEERADTRAQRRSFEQSEKAKVRKRDGGCRWPHCDCRQRGLPIETAHVNDKGMGGDHGKRSTADQMIRLCRPKHQGPVSVHSGDLKIEPLSGMGTDGPCSFWKRDAEDGSWFLFAEETAIGVYRKD